MSINYEIELGRMEDGHRKSHISGHLSAQNKRECERRAARCRVFRRATRPAGRPASDISSHTVRTVDTKTTWQEPAVWRFLNAGQVDRRPAPLE